MLEVHHLNNSRSQRILWLLEELGLDYRIVKHQRDATTSLAPPSLLAVHPLGKSPVIRDDGLVVIESGAIGLVTTHDLALTEIVDSLGGKAVNVHFEDRLVAGRVTFDYLLRPGVVQRTNALELMRMIGLEV